MSKWPMVPLSNIMELRLDSEEVDPSKLYPFSGVYSFGRGLFVRENLKGSETTYKKFNRLHVDDFVISQPKAWEGAIARITEEHRGRYLSPVFPTFRLDTVKMIPKFLDLFLRRATIWRALHQKAKGLGARRESVSPEAFLSLEIPLPPLSEQQKIVEWVGAVASRVEEAKELVEETTKEIDDLTRSILWASKADSTPTRMSDLVEQRTPDVEVTPHDTYDFAGVYCFGRGVFQGQTKTGMDFKYSKLTRLKARNFTYPKLMAWEGAFGVVPDECDGLVVSTEYPVFEINEEKLLPDVLDVYFKTSSIWPIIAGASTGTNARRRRLNPKDFLKHEFPLPPRKVQEKIAEIRSRTEGPLAQRQETIDELNGLMKSVLNQIFNGDDDG